MLRQTVRPTEIELHLSPCGSSTWRRWETYCRPHGHSSNRGKSSAAKQLEWAKRLSWSSEYRLNGELSRSRHQEIDLNWSKGQSIMRRWEAAKGSAGATSTSVSPKRHREYLPPRCIIWPSVHCDDEGWQESLIRLLRFNRVAFIYNNNSKCTLLNF